MRTKFFFRQITNQEMQKIVPSCFRFGKTLFLALIFFMMTISYLKAQTAMKQPGSATIKRYSPVINSTASQSSPIQQTEKKVLKIIHTNDFKITGDGNEPDWDKAEWISLNRYNDTSNTYNTQFKILYSGTGIYCLYKCEDKKISCTLKGDFLDLYNEDVVEVFFWPDESFPVYFEYELSPLNYELPIIVPDKKGSFFGWLPWHYTGDRKTKHATHITRKSGSVTGWTAEFFIPYSLLKPLINTPPKKGDRWRANFYRIDYDKNETDWEWNRVRDTNFHDYERFGTIVFD